MHEINKESKVGKSLKIIREMVPAQIIKISLWIIKNICSKNVRHDIIKTSLKMQILCIAKISIIKFQIMKCYIYFNQSTNHYSISTTISLIGRKDVFGLSSTIILTSSFLTSPSSLGRTLVTIPIGQQKHSFELRSISVDFEVHWGIQFSSVSRI